MHEMSSKMFTLLKLGHKAMMSSSASASDTEHAPRSSDSSKVPNEPGSNTPLKENILAFRTIITLLSTIQEAGAINLTTNIESFGEERATLRVLAALATVLVRKHEVVTVATLPNGQSQVGKSLKVTACAQLDRTDDSENKQPNTSQTGDIQPKPSLWALFTTKNFRRDDNVQSPSDVLAKDDLEGGDPASLLASCMQRNTYVRFETFQRET